MVDARSPIQRMIDEATGFDPSKAKPFVTLRCPKCAKEKRAPSDASDPEGARVVVASCPECSDGYEKEAVFYLDESGKTIGHSI